MALTEGEIREKLGLTSSAEQQFRSMEKVVGNVLAGRITREDAIDQRHRGSGRTTNTMVAMLQQLSADDIGRIFFIARGQPQAAQVKVVMESYCRRLGIKCGPRLVIMSTEQAQHDLTGYTEGGENPPTFYDHS